MDSEFALPPEKFPAACPRVVMCISSFKRTRQLEQTLAINLLLAWKWRTHVCFVLALVDVLLFVGGCVFRGSYMWMCLVDLSRFFQ